MVHLGHMNANRVAADMFLSPALAQLRHSTGAGEITSQVTFRPGLSLFADPALAVAGHWRSPAGRLLELDIDTAGHGDWIALHVTVNAPDLTRTGFVGFGCSSAGTGMQVIRPCLRSGLADGGFIDCFFDRHILTRPGPVSHVDALHVPTRRRIPETAPWRELLLFLPTAPLRWHLHDLRVFAA